MTTPFVVPLLLLILGCMPLRGTRIYICIIPIIIGVWTSVFATPFIPEPMLTVMLGTLGSLVQWYAMDTLKSQRFARLLNAFIFSMFLLLWATNWWMFFIGWEGIGLCSFFLIGFFREKHPARQAARKAFIINRLGDAGLLIVILWYMHTQESLDFSAMHTATIMPTGVFICLLIAIGIKSAQYGGHTWLIGAMAGPTPASALMHSATLVLAGIILCMRVSPCLSSMQLILLCALGGLTFIVQGINACRHFDIKKILAYSTSSHLGLMLYGVGKEYSHDVITYMCAHGAGKALLFLIAGTTITANKGTQDIRHLSLRSTSPTSMIFICALITFVAPFPFAMGAAKGLLIQESLSKAIILFISMSYCTRLGYFLLKEPQSITVPLSSRSLYGLIVCVLLLLPFYAYEPHTLITITLEWTSFCLLALFYIFLFKQRKNSVSDSISPRHRFSFFIIGQKIHAIDDQINTTLYRVYTLLKSARLGIQEYRSLLWTFRWYGICILAISIFYGAKICF